MTTPLDLTAAVLLSADGLPGWLISAPDAVSASDAAGLVQDTLTATFSPGINPWGVLTALDLPTAINMTATIKLGATTYSSGQFHVGPANWSSGSGGVLTLTGKRLSRRGYQAIRLLNAASRLLAGSRVTEPIYQSVRMANDFTSRISVLRLYGYGVHVDAAGDFQIFRLDTLWQAGRRADGPFSGIDDTPVPLPGASGSIAIPDIETRQDYAGANLFARVNNGTTPSLGYRVGIGGGRYEPQEGQVERQVPGIFTDVLAASLRLSGEVQQVRLQAETAMIDSPMVPETLALVPGSVVDWMARPWVCLAVTQDTASLSTTLECVGYR